MAVVKEVDRLVVKTHEATEISHYSCISLGYFCLTSSMEHATFGDWNEQMRLQPVLLVMQNGSKQKQINQTSMKNKRGKNHINYALIIISLIIYNF